MRGSRRTSGRCCAEAVQHFRCPVVRLKGIIFGEIEAQKQPLIISTQPETGATLYTPPQQLLRRTLSDRAYTPSLLNKGIEWIDVGNARTGGERGRGELRGAFRCGGGGDGGRVPDVRGQVEDIILGNRDAKLASGHLTQPETGATLIYATSAVLQRTLSDRAYALSVSRKGLSVCLNVPRTSSTSSEPQWCRLKHQSAS
ncbi:hypothetical protein TNIN_242251 [Trichonephila inaurata madagascariensis]|uniref:Uncharacterized protein n=1 Tax=Trichonephila inaurata madagascariensis TaxID=2747483 RepID=A0A8X7CA97_9ARAC|nr:hypothetical protein TNIN_242251 [Trichonephila inaurata madagascariensis]